MPQFLVTLNCSQLVQTKIPIHAHSSAEAEEKASAMIYTDTDGWEPAGGFDPVDVVDVEFDSP